MKSRFVVIVTFFVLAGQQAMPQQEVKEAVRPPPQRWWRGFEGRAPSRRAHYAVSAHTPGRWPISAKIRTAGAVASHIPAGGISDVLS